MEVIPGLTIEHLQKIKEKEELAEKIRQDGLSESLRILAEARNEAAIIISNANAEAEKHYDELITKANEEAEEDYEKIIHSAKWECDMLSESAEKNREEAVSLIVKRIMGPWRS